MDKPVDYYMSLPYTVELKPDGKKWYRASGTEAAVVAALTVLEASMVRDADFERLQEALREHVEAHPQLSPTAALGSRNRLSDARDAF